MSLARELKKDCVSQYAFTAERGHIAEALQIYECTEDADPEAIAEDLPERFQLWSALLCPTDLGDCMKKKRRWTWAVDTSVYRLVDDPSMFLSRFGRSQQMSPSELYCAPADVSKLEWDATLAKRVTAVDDPDLTWEDLLMVSQRTFKNGYAEKILQMQRDAKHIVDEEWMVDLDHNPNVQPRMCHTHPLQVKPLNTLISHGCWWHFGHERWLQGVEKLVAHAYPALPHMSDSLNVESPLDFLELLQTEKIRMGEVHSAAGLGWHLGVAGSLLMWLLANPEPIDRLVPLQRRR